MIYNKYTRTGYNDFAYFSAPTTANFGWYQDLIARGVTDVGGTIEAARRGGKRFINSVKNNEDFMTTDEILSIPDTIKKRFRQRGETVDRLTDLANSTTANTQARQARARTVNAAQRLSNQAGDDAFVPSSSGYTRRRGTSTTTLMPDSSGSASRQTKGVWGAEDSSPSAERTWSNR